MTSAEYAEIEALIDAVLNTKQIMKRTGYSEALVLEARAERTRRKACERTARNKAMAGLSGGAPTHDDGRFLAALLAHMPPPDQVPGSLGVPVWIGRAA